MAITNVAFNVLPRANFHRLLGQYEPGGDWREIQVDESGRILTYTYLGPGDEAIGAVELKDHDSNVRADVSPTGSLFGNGLHSLCFVDPTGGVRPAAVDVQGRVLLSNVDIQIGAVELKNFDTNLRAEVSAPGTTFGPALHALVFQDATGRAQAALVDESGRVMLSEIDIQIGAVELKDHDSGLRGSITNAGAAFGPAQHTMPFVDGTGNAQAALVDSSGHLQADILSGGIAENADTIASGNKTVGAAGVREQLGASQAVPDGHSVHIVALSTNGGFVYVGGPAVSAANGHQLLAGWSVNLAANNIDDIWLDVSVGGEGVTWIVEI